ncbi:MAG: YraN family protein [Burkholderiaceae bacterium]|jgi:putative endonuclease|nr:YraN family protein [Burkholderiaceae bacterium]
MPTRGTPTRATGVRTPKQRAGAAAEDAAARHMTAAGCRLLARNARYREGELDLVVQDRDLVVFVEVRMRTGTRFGGAPASVDRFKQKRLARAAERWLLEHYGERWPACRFDVVTLSGDGTIDWIRDAFAK